MPAQNLHRENKEGIYYHVYNKGVEKRIIFNDGQDYEVFLGYLKDYLTHPKDPESVKKVFVLHGRTFRGTPHLPKNYFGKIELIAYSLMPDHFHLLLAQIRKGCLESFIRSLCTRYSMYFNKKYQRSGTLFAGPYKSVPIKKELLSHLTRYIYHGGDDSSYPEYLGKRSTSWVKGEVVLSLFDKGISGYKDFVEKYGLDKKEMELIHGITFESETEHLERIDPARNEGIDLDADLKPPSRMLEFVTICCVLFILLLSIGIRNIQVASSNSPQSLPTPEVLPASTENVKPEVKSEESSRATLTVKTGDEFSIVNIRQKPATDSAKIGKARDGDTFEFISKDQEWYEVKLASGGSGFISAKYIVREEPKY